MEEESSRGDADRNESGQYEGPQNNVEPSLPPATTDPSAVTSSVTQSVKPKSKTGHKELAMASPKIPQLQYIRPSSNLSNSSSGSDKSKNIDVTDSAVKPPVEETEPENEPSNSATPGPLGAQPEPEVIVTVPGTGKTPVDVRMTNEDADTVYMSMVNPPPGQRSLMSESPNNTNRNNKRCVIS